jgi:type II secretory pathway pseudopilin PulG
MHEDLLGYLLGALEPHEMERVAALLRQDPEARRQLIEIQRSLRPLEDNYEPGQSPPSDLVARTLNQVESSAQPDHEFASSGLPTMQASNHRPRSRSVTWLDLAALSAAAAILLALLVPNIANRRFEARRTACQNQLRGLGIAITTFVNRNEQHRLPAVAKSGPEAFAGVYAVRLSDLGLFEDTDTRWCPSLDAPGDDQLQFTALNQLPTIQQLHESSADVLRRFQTFSGGHYAYTLGVVDKDRFESPRFESRASFAVMSDAPMAGTPNESNLRESIGHDGRGINVLYEDGRVRFIDVSSLDVLPDHPFFNHRGQAEAGVNVDDASLAPSWRPPFVEVFQR